MVISVLPLSLDADIQQILKSINTKQPIHELAEQIINSYGAGLNHTLALYHRIAFLVRLPILAVGFFWTENPLQRHHVGEKHGPHVHWEKVDTELDELYALPPEDYVE